MLTMDGVGNDVEKCPKFLFYNKRNLNLNSMMKVVKNCDEEEDCDNEVKNENNDYGDNDAADHGDNSDEGDDGNEKE